MKYTYTKEKIQEAVNKSHSIANVLRELNIMVTGGSHNHIKKQINKFNIDITHFTGQGHAKGKISNRKLEPHEVLRHRPNSDIRQSHKILKRALIESGIEYKCNRCGIKDWNGKPITLDVNHKDENWLNDTKDNLEFLCPNCHSQYNGPVA